MLSLLLLVLAPTASNALFQKWIPPINDESCDYTREDAYMCIAYYMDTNKDDLISHVELDDALDRYAPAWVRVAKWFISTKQAFDACDYDKDGFISGDDWSNAFEKNKDCLPLKNNWCQVQWFCNRAMHIEKKTHKKK